MSGSQPSQQRVPSFGNEDDLSTFRFKLNDLKAIIHAFETVVQSRKSKDEVKELLDWFKYNNLPSMSTLYLCFLDTSRVTTSLYLLDGQEKNLNQSVVCHINLLCNFAEEWSVENNRQMDSYD
jgi:hypothetical protein